MTPSRGDENSVRAMPAARAADASHSSLFHVLTIGSIAIAAFAAIYFGLQLLRGVVERYCKRGHLRTNETTFERKVHVDGKDYIVRDCRVCHAMRNTNAPSWSKGQSRSKWSGLRGRL